MWPIVALYLRPSDALSETLNGRYISAVDSGTKAFDMDCIAQQTQHVTSTSSAGDPSPHTAMGVFAGIHPAARHGAFGL